MDALLASYGDSNSDSDTDLNLSAQDSIAPQNPPPSPPPTPLPPPPLSLLTPPNSFHGTIDNLQTGQPARVRSFPHVEGNYAVHVYIPEVCAMDVEQKELHKIDVLQGARNTLTLGNERTTPPPIDGCPDAWQGGDTRVESSQDDPHVCSTGRPKSPLHPLQSTLTPCGNVGYSNPASHHEQSPKKMRYEEGSSCGELSFWELDEYGKDKRIDKVMNRLHCDVDNVRNKLNFDDVAEYRAMLRSWAEFSVRAMAFAESGLSIQTLTNERDESREEVRILRDELDEVKTRLAVAKLSSQKRYEVMAKLKRVQRERSQAREELAQAKSELESIKVKLDDAEKQLIISQKEMVDAWLETESGKAYIADESLEAYLLGEEEAMNRLRVVLQSMHPDIPFEPIVAKCEEIRDNELADMMSKGEY